jgi:hypothetical protein
VRFTALVALEPSASDSGNATWFCGPLCAHLRSRAADEPRLVVGGNVDPVDVDADEPAMVCVDSEAVGLSAERELVDLPPSMFLRNLNTQMPKARRG